MPCRRHPAAGPFLAIIAAVLIFCTGARSLVFAASTDSVQVRENLTISMRDGIATYADVYLPAGDPPFPTILSRIPYGKQTDYLKQPEVGRFWAERGYAYVSQDVRGRFGSQGMFAAYGGGQEEQDGYDTVDWISRQPWSNGRVGLMGESYFGYTSLAAAWSGHPAIKAISPANITVAREKQVLDGAYPILASGLWTLGLDDIENGQYQDGARDVDKYHLPLITLGEAHGFRDRMWRDRITGYLDQPREKLAQAREQYARTRVPALHFGGWYDSFTRGTIAIWEGIREHSDHPGARDQQWLVMGPWDHNNMSDHITGNPPKTNVGRLSTGTASDKTYTELLLAFFDYTLKGLDNGFGERPRVQYFNVGANEWRFSDQWPPADIDYEYLYLHSDGRAGQPEGGQLEREPPASPQPADQFHYDPRNPVDVTAGSDIWSRGPGQTDRAELVRRADVLSYTTAPLAEPLDITGPITLELHAASSATDTDFTAALVHVFPDGYSLLIQEGILRASFRDKNADPSPLEPGRVYRFDVDLWATSYTVPEGHRLRLEVSSSNFPRFARNLNNGETFGMSDRIVVAEQTVLHSPEHLSRLRLPVRRAH